jgi:hypothetical protein
VVTFVEMILSSVENCFLIGSLTIPKSFPYNTGLFSVILVTGTIFLSSTGAERHLKANGFVTSPDFFSISIDGFHPSWSTFLRYSVVSKIQ